MAKKNKLDVSQIHYLHIKDLGFEYSAADTNVKFQPPDESVLFDVGIIKTIGIDEKVIRLIITVELKSHADNGKETSAGYTTEHLFKIENVRDLVSKTGTIIEVDPALDKTLTGLAYSTVRGLLRQKFIGTSFSHFILPIIRPADLGKPDSEQKIQKD